MVEREFITNGCCRPSGLGRPFRRCAAKSPPQSRVLKALLRCSLVWCLSSASVVASRQKTALSLAAVLAGNLAFRSRGNPAHTSAVSAHSVFWFLAQWVKFLQGIGSRHSALGAKSKIKGKQALNK